MKPETPLDPDAVFNTARKLALTCGDQAYHEATSGAVLGVALNDQQGARLYAGAAILLMKHGYHKYPQRKEATDATRNVIT